MLNQHDSLTLCPLVLGILATESQAAVHLRKVLGTKDEHELVLQRAVAMHIAHRLQIVLFALIKSSLQGLQLGVKCRDGTVEYIQVVTYGVDGAALVGNFRVDDLEILQTLLHITSIGLKLTFLFLDLLLYLLTLVLQALDAWGRRFRSRGLCLLGCSFLGRSILCGSLLVVAGLAADFLFVVFVVLVFCCADFFVCAITTLADSSQQPKSRNQKERDFIKGLQSHETL